MKRLLAFVLTLASLLALCGGLFSCASSPKKYTDYSFDYFDTTTTIIGYETDEQTFVENLVWIKGLLREYHRLYDIYTQYSGINNLATINLRENGEHVPVVVDQKIIDMLLFAKEMYAETGGNINIAMGSVLRIWHEYRSWGAKHPTEAELPPMADLEAAAEHTNIDDLLIDDETNTVYLADPDLYLDVGAIAKGYAVEMVAQEMERRGISGYLLNVGGNIRAVGAGPNGKLWQAGIQNPDKNSSTPHIAYLKLDDMSLVTSGVYQRYYVVDDKQYHHIIDPTTLMPSESYLSVSVLTAHSGRADGLSTGLFSMSLEDGMALVESLDGVEAQWVLPDGTIYTSSGFSAYTFVP